MPNILLAIISNASTPKRLKLLNSVLVEAARLNKFADTVVIANSKEAKEYAHGLMFKIEGIGENVGQHIAFNLAMEIAIDCAYDYLVRIDDDVKFTSKTWLKDLIAVSKAMEDKAVISALPRHIKVDLHKMQDVFSVPVLVKNHKVLFSVGGLSGLCRLHPVKLHKQIPYTSDVRLPLGSGDPTCLGRWAIAHKVPLVLAADIIVKHVDTRAEEDSVYDELRQTNARIPYITTGEGNG